MDIKDHGNWERYTPEKPPEGAPANAMYARRVGYGTDWYDYVNASHNFAEDSIKLTVVNNVVATATYDATALFPAGATVLEISDISTDDPLAMFGRKTYDAAHKTFKDPAPLPDLGPSIPELLRRIEELEKREK